MKKIFILALVAISFQSKAQSITVGPVDYFTACSKLLDMGYVIDRKDNDLQTASTLSNRDQHELAITIRVKTDGTMEVKGQVPGFHGNWYTVTPMFKKPWKDMETFAAIFGNTTIVKR